MRPSLVLSALTLAACGPPSWPDVATPAEVDTVRLEVIPADPIEGESVRMNLPMETGNGCHAYDGPQHTETIDGETRITFDDATSGACPVVAASCCGSSVTFGALTAGHYVVTIDGRTLPFDVQPASTPPGPPPQLWEIAHAIAVQNHAPSACGETYARETPGMSWAERAARLRHQVAFAHPDWSDGEVEGAMCIAQSVMLRPVSDHELRYRHSASTLCHVADAIGTVHLHEDGTFTIDAPYIVDGHDVPC